MTKPFQRQDRTAGKRSLRDRLLSASLRTKVLTVAIAMNLVTVALLSWQSASKLQTVYLSQLALRGHALSQTAVTALEPAMLDNSRIKVLGILNDLKPVPGLAYALALDGNGRVVAHTFDTALPAGLASLHPLESGQESTSDSVLEVDGRSVLDISYPLLQGAVGELRIGMDLTEARAQVRASVRRGMLMTAVFLAAGTLALWFLLGLLVEPVNQLAEATRKIVEDGDLSHELSFTAYDEVGRLGRNFQAMVVKLREIPRRLDDSVQLLGQAVRHLEGVTDEQQLNVDQQAAALHQTQVTATEIRQTSRSASERAQEILSHSEGAGAVSAEGEAAVVRSLASMQEMKDQIAVTADRINALHRRMVEVKAIADTVKDLADQSNMLALNAAIEAVRSGEHGKGFALVAREIRRLADQSIQATDQVREILDGVGVALNETVQITGRGARRMESEMAEVKKSGESLTQLAGLVKTTAGSVGQIAVAVTQQDEGIDQIFTAVTQQSDMMGRTQAQLFSVKESLEKLKGISDSLSEMLGHYKA